MADLEEQKYQVGEKVLCERDNCWYKAKVMGIVLRYYRIYYMVHCVGCRGAWDESVLSDKLCPETAKHVCLTDSAKQRAKLRSAFCTYRPEVTVDVKRKFSMNSRPSAPCNNRLIDVRKPQPSRRAVKKGACLAGQRVCDEFDADNDARLERLLDGIERTPFLINIPEALLDILHDERHWICAECWLPVLPANPNVRDILSTFVEECHEKGIRWRFAFNLDKFKAAVITLFDHILPLRLLHRFERLQLVQVIKADPTRPFSEIYGYTHVVRMCFKLSELFVESNVRRTDVQRLMPVLERFLEFLSNHEKEWLTNDTYQSALPAYVRATYWD